jgi:hypothetical protein
MNENLIITDSKFINQSNNLINKIDLPLAKIASWIRHIDPILFETLQKKDSVKTKPIITLDTKNNKLIVENINDDFYPKSIEIKGLVYHLIKKENYFEILDENFNVLKQLESNNEITDINLEESDQGPICLIYDNDRKVKIYDFINEDSISSLPSFDLINKNTSQDENLKYLTLQNTVENSDSHLLYILKTNRYLHDIEVDSVIISLGESLIFTNKDKKVFLYTPSIDKVHGPFDNEQTLFSTYVVFDNNGKKILYDEYGPLDQLKDLNYLENVGSYIKFKNGEGEEIVLDSNLQTKIEKASTIEKLGNDYVYLKDNTLYSIDYYFESKGLKDIESIEKQGNY